MPGILPMKVIKVGSNAQTRIAQACDRCRSKKIRCDGIRPSCSQCLNVGFECRTSDKLSRRAFPRGYTESLEERVRALEAEVRELKILLDEKDEKIDMLSRIHSHSPQPLNSPRKPSTSSPQLPGDRRADSRPKDDVFKVQQSPLLLDDTNCDTYFMGTSSGRTFIESFKNKVLETGRPCADIKPEAFFTAGLTAQKEVEKQGERIVSWKAPPRMVSDQMINIFFQEWAPLFPVLHRPTFLHLYEDYVSSPDVMGDRKSIAQLNLVFGIAALSSNVLDSADSESFEVQWQTSLESFIMDNSLSTLQCLVLAQIHSLLKADYTRLLKYKGLAVSLCQRLGLHQSQKRFALGALTSETRKKIFWTQYTIDCFSAAHLGLPRLFREEDIHCEYPVDADDEYVTEKGFLPTLPGEYTKLSSALALFRAARILAKVLAENYPAAASHELSFGTMAALSDELENWLNHLAPHLRLQFAQDKLSTSVTSSRSPILSLAYHYIRCLIYRPAVCAGLGDRASSAVVALADSSKHMVQILQLLEERNLSFSFCLNKQELLLLSGFGLLFQTLGLNQDGPLIKDSQRRVCAVIDLLEKCRAPSAAEFLRVGCSMITIPRETITPTPGLARHNSDGNAPTPHLGFRAIQRQLKAKAAPGVAAAAVAAAKTAAKTARPEPKDRRATLPSLGRLASHSEASLSALRPDVHITRSEPALSPVMNRSAQKRPSHARQTPNLDYLSFGPDPVSNTFNFADISAGKVEMSSSDWERLLGSLDNGQTNIYDTIYGGTPADALVDVTPLSATADYHLTWSPGTWGVNSVGQHQTPQSVLSFSDESLSSGEEFAPCDLVPNANDRVYCGIMIPELGPEGHTSINLAALDVNYSL